mmetsp:Transcript_10419/g.24562  ORF Transcript_10419/g.24562 Transcript_10419/m.24562 type:complete len:284 (+) Transcript_10419:670-1521(+)
MLGDALIPKTHVVHVAGAPDAPISKYAVHCDTSFTRSAFMDAFADLFQRAIASHAATVSMHLDLSSSRTPTVTTAGCAGCPSLPRAEYARLWDYLVAAHRLLKHTETWLSAIARRELDLSVAISLARCLSRIAASTPLAPLRYLAIPWTQAIRGTALRRFQRTVAGRPTLVVYILHDAAARTKALTSGLLPLRPGTEDARNRVAVLAWTHEGALRLIHLCSRAIGRSIDLKEEIVVARLRHMKTQTPCDHGGRCSTGVSTLRFCPFIPATIKLPFTCRQRNAI